MPTDIYPTTILEFLHQIARYGPKPALGTYGEDDVLSYEQLIRRILRVAANLKEQAHLSPGDRVVLYGLRGPDWVSAFFGCLIGGYVVVPVDVRMSTELVNDLIKHTEPKLLVSQEVTDLKAPSDIKLFKQLLETSSAELKLEGFEQLDGDTLAEIILTSGTWSQPKGVTLTHKNLLSNLAGVDSTYTLADGAKLLSLLPLSHAYEQMCGLFIPLFRGATITYMSEIQPDTLTDAIKRHQISTIVAVPRILELLQKGVLKQLSPSKRAAFKKFVIQARWLPFTARRAIFSKVHRSLGTSLKTLVIGGAPLQQELDYFFQGLGYTVLVGYGLSETSPVLCVSLDQRRPPGRVGQPMFNVSLKLNEAGEVLAEGDNVFYGYWPERRPQEPFNTGDLGRFDRKGNLLLIGRSKNLVIFPSGDKIFLEDIEQLANILPEVAESCVANLGDDRNPHLHLFVVTDSQTLEPMRELINTKLPFGIRVTSISLASTAVLARTHTLKLNRQQIMRDHAQLIASLTAQSS